MHSSTLEQTEYGPANGLRLDFVLPIPKENLTAYRRTAQRAGSIWRKHGTLEFRECVSDDLNVKMGSLFVLI
jgi:uncharacterized protein YbaA (DUF1428 family)